MENKLQKTETKYYLPKIEEFHSGFEFEMYVAGSDTEYTKEVFNLTSMISTSIQNIYNKNLEYGWIRAKCLDRADIEELGWEESPDEPEEWFWAYKGNQENQLYIDTIPQLGGIKGIEIFTEFGLSFRGYIRNKSELRKIMERLGIIQFKPLNLL